MMRRFENESGTLQWIFIEANETMNTDINRYKIECYRHRNAFININATFTVECKLQESANRVLNQRK